MYSIGDLSKRTGVKIPTIRYYEQMGLIAAADRSSGNQRRYTKDGLARLSFIRHARDLGLSLADIHELVDLSHAPDRPCAEAHCITARHLETINAKLQRLRNLQRELKRIAALPDDGTVGACSVIQALADHALCETDHKPIQA
nr:helix-turn-helix domain-containing protein [Amylibacter sp.]